MFLAKRIKETRIQKGLTQQELGDALGVTKVSICNWEKGIKKPSTKNLIAISQLLNVDLNFLIGSDNYVISETEDKYGTMMTSEEILIIKELRNHKKIYDTISENPKRALDRIEKSLF